MSRRSAILKARTSRFIFRFPNRVPPGRFFTLALMIPPTIWLGVRRSRWLRPDSTRPTKRRFLQPVPISTSIGRSGRIGFPASSRPKSNGALLPKTKNFRSDSRWTDRKSFFFPTRRGRFRWHLRAVKPCRKRSRCRMIPGSRVRRCGSMGMISDGCRHGCFRAGRTESNCSSRLNRMRRTTEKSCRFTSTAALR